MDWVEPLNNLRHLILVHPNTVKAQSIIKELEQNIAPHQWELYTPFMELVGLFYNQLKQYDDAIQCFLRIEDHYQAGYSALLAGNAKEAANLWRNLLQKRSNHWCLTLHGLVTDQLASMPTFLQLRNHFEGDIINLYRAGQQEMALNMVRYAGYLSELNFEVYKYAGRAFLHVERFELAGPLLFKGQKILPNDPEVYYHLGQYYQAIQQSEEAMMALNQCLLITPEYFPAIRLKQQMISQTV